MLLACEFEQVGYRLVAFRDAPELAGYYAQFERAANRPEPDEIRPCEGEKPRRRDRDADRGGEQEPADAA